MGMQKAGLGAVSLMALVIGASAPARADLDITMGGYTDVQAAIFENDDPNNTNRDFQSEAEIFITAKAKTDYGLEYGAYLELYGSTSDTANTDEVNIFLAGNWGRLELGDQDGAGSELAVNAPYVGLGQAMGSFNDYIPSGDRAYGRVDTAADASIKAIDTADATKITYYTPRFQGFQAGVSYAPERDSQADGEGVQLFKNVGNHADAFEFGLNYKAEFNDVNLTLGGEYVMADAKTGSGLEDIRAWTVGGKIGYQGFTFGGGYTHNGDSGMPVGGANDSNTIWNVGLTYTQGPWGVGASYVHSDFDQTGTPFGLTVTGAGGTFAAWGLGATYKIAPGLATSLDFVSFDRNRDVGADTSGYVVVTEMRATF